MTRNLILAACAAFALQTLTSFAGPVRRADLPAEPSWVIHVDCDALRASPIGQAVLRELEKPEAENKFASFRAMFNFDPRTAMHAVSLYGSGSNPEDGVMVVYADFDGDRLENLVRGAKEYTSSTHRSRTIHSWVDDKKTSTPQRMYGAVAANRVVFARRLDRMEAALDVIDGFAANLAGSKVFPTLGSASKGVFVQTAGRKLQLAEGSPNAALFRMSQEMRMEMAEADGTLNGTFNLVAADEQVAQHMNSIAQGLLALMRMQTDKPARAKLAQSITLELQGAELNGKMTMPTVEFLEIAKAAVAAKRQ